MKGFLKKVFRMKTKVYPKMNCDDFVSKRAQEPSLEEIRQVVRCQVSKGENDSGMDQAVDAMAFNLRYRCGGQGRCINNDFACRYPCCFSLRPLLKGTEIFSERSSYEIDDPPIAGAKAVVQLCREDKLDRAIESLQTLINSTIRKYAATEKVTEDAVLERCDEARCDITPLLLWRAALLTNVRGDDRAVAMLLNAAKQFPSHCRGQLVAAAATWAVFHDMEVIYYRSLLLTHESFPFAESMAREKQLLLKQVLEFIQSDKNLLSIVASVVVGKELGSTAAKAQAASTNDDETENPLQTAAIPLALTYYRFNLGEEFWREILSLLLLPPEAPDGQTTESYIPSEAEVVSGVPPPFILDANCRVIYLHHLLRLSNEREEDIRSGKVALPAHPEKLSRDEQAKYALFLSPPELSVCKRRLQEMLQLSQQYQRSLLTVATEMREVMEKEKK